MHHSISLSDRAAHGKIVAPFRHGIRFEPSQPLVNLPEQGFPQTRSPWRAPLALILGLSFLLGPPATLLVFAFSSLLALREFLTLSETIPEDHAALCVSFFLVLPFQNFLVSIQWYGLFTIMIPVYAFLILPVFPAIRQQTARFLVLSAVKRSLGAKDWGTSIAGHGGVLDRLDSLSFSAPIFFHLVRSFFAV